MTYRQLIRILPLLLLSILITACATTGVSPEKKRQAEAARNLGEAHLREGNPTMALRELLKAQELNPEDPVLYNDMGLVYMAKEKYDIAIQQFEKALQLNPNYSPAKNNLGSAYLAKKEWDKAIRMLENVTGDMLYATPHFPLANLGWAYYNKGDYAKAEKYLKEALDLNPDFFIARLNLGRTYLATGRLHAARSIFEDLAKETPKNPVLLLEMGRTYRLLGNYNNATLALKGAIEYSEDSDLALEAASELRKIYQ
jgi:type IV pilus assembly protein PilF